jgi:hypothetical protein
VRASSLLGDGAACGAVDALHRRRQSDAILNSRKGAILTDNFNGVNIDVPEGKETSVGNFGIFFTQTGGVSAQAGNTAKLKHPTGIFVGTTGTGSTGGKNDEQIEGIELRYETGAQKTTALEFRFNPPIFAWAADVYSVDGKSFEPYRRENGDHTTLHILGHAFDLAQIFTYSGSGYDSFFGIVSDQPFDKISFTAGGDGDRWRLDNVSIAR